MRLLFKKLVLSVMMLVSVISYAQQEALEIMAQLFEIKELSDPSLMMHMRKRIEAYIRLLIDSLPLKTETFDENEWLQLNELRLKITQLLEQRMRQPGVSRDKDYLLNVLTRALNNGWIDETNYNQLKEVLNAPSMEGVDFLSGSPRNDVSPRHLDLTQVGSPRLQCLESMLGKLTSFETPSLSAQLQMRFRLLMRNLIQKMRDCPRNEINDQKISDILRIHLDQLPREDLVAEVANMLQERIDNLALDDMQYELLGVIQDALNNNWINEDVYCGLISSLEGSNESIGRRTRTPSPLETSADKRGGWILPLGNVLRVPEMALLLGRDGPSVVSFTQPGSSLK